MQDPVLAGDGFSYERAAIEDWFAKGHRTSPKTGLKSACAACIPLPCHPFECPFAASALASPFLPEDLAVRVDVESSDDDHPLPSCQAMV